MDRHGVAVDVNDISKVYRLWNTPKDRLVYSLTQAFSSKLFRMGHDQQKNYRDFFALKNVSLTIRKGESWGFVGVNGSGKSTLLKILSGNLRPSSGRVTVNGRIVILDYSNGFNTDFTGKENIYTKATLLGLTRKQINARYKSIVDFAELEDFIDQPVKKYSSGMIARLGFAIIAHVDADIIIADEALTVGDAFFLQKCMKFIKNFIEQGTFIFVSHSTSDVLSLCQKVVWLEQGTVKSTGSSKVVVNAYLKSQNPKPDSKTTMNDSESQPSNLDDDVNVMQPITLGPTSGEKIEGFCSDKQKRTNPPSPLPIMQHWPIPKFETNIAIDKERASILELNLQDENGATCTYFKGGELVALLIKARSIGKLYSPVVGFQVLDRLGQTCFEGSSYLTIQHQPFTVETETLFGSRIVFRMPLLSPGSYVIRAFVAQVASENSEVTMLSKIDSSLAFYLVTAGKRHGLIGTPMQSIRFKCQGIDASI